MTIWAQMTLVGKDHISSSVFTQVCVLRCVTEWRIWSLALDLCARGLASFVFADSPWPSHHLRGPYSQPRHGRTENIWAWYKKTTLLIYADFKIPSFHIQLDMSSSPSPASVLPARTTKFYLDSLVSTLTDETPFISGVYQLPKNMLSLLYGKETTGGLVSRPTSNLCSLLYMY